MVGQILSNPDCDELPAPVSLAGHMGGTPKPIIVLGKTGRGEGAALLILTECDKILASRVVGRSCLTLIVTNSRPR